MEALRPDLVTLDLEMPDLNGLQVLEEMAKSGIRSSALMLSSHTVRGGELTVRALEFGAFDFLTKPEAGADGLGQLTRSLAARIQAFEQRREIRHILRGTPMRVPAQTVPLAERFCRKPPLVLIGVSTGGPAALAELLPAIPRTFAAPLLIVQHMPPLFTEALARSLAAKSVIPVREAREGEAALPGVAYIAPGGRHMRLAQGPAGEVLIRLDDSPPENYCRPAVDALFRSAAEHFPRRSISAILTGMGSDGTEGLRHLKRAGCISLAQDEASATVFGMPREAALAGLVDYVLPLSQIAAALIRHVGEAR